MRLVPAIDLLGGRCVRLLRGDFDAETRYAADPRAQVITAAGQGSAAAIALNAALVEEDIKNAVLALRSGYTT